MKPKYPNGSPNGFIKSTLPLKDEAAQDSSIKGIGTTLTLWGNVIGQPNKNWCTYECQRYWLCASNVPQWSDSLSQFCKSMNPLNLSAIRNRLRQSELDTVKENGEGIKMVDDVLIL